MHLHRYSQPSAALQVHQHALIDSSTVSCMDVLGLLHEMARLLRPSLQVPLGQVAVHSYEEQTASRRKRASAPASTLPSAGEAEALLDLNRDLFTDDAWQGMQRRAACLAVLLICSALLL